MSIKDSKAELNTITYDRDKIEGKVGSIYEAIVIMGKRAEQINEPIKKRTSLDKAPNPYRDWETDRKSVV